MTKRRRWPWALILVALGGLVSLAGGWLAVRSFTNGKLAAAIAEADRLDPGWRLPDLIARREKIPDAENAAIRVAEVAARLPAKWPTNPPAPSFDETGGPTPITPPTGDELIQRLLDRAEGELIDEEERTGLRSELAVLGPALTTARTLATLRRGRFDRAVEQGVLSIDSNINSQARRVAKLLQIDAAQRADRGDGDGALESCRAMLGISRALQDDPILIGQLFRLAIERAALTSFVRALALTEPGESALATIQDEWTREAAYPALLQAARGERTFAYGMSTRTIQDGSRPYANDTSFWVPRDRLGVAAEWLDPRRFHTYNQAIELDLANRAVEIAKRPPAEQAKLWEDWAKSARPRSPIARGLGASAYSVVDAYEMAARATLNLHALCQVAATISAAERHRRRSGRWPATVEDLRPDFPGGLPTDPWSGQPIRLTRRDDGLAVYSIGRDRKDNGGTFDPKFRSSDGTDQGFRLQDPRHRRRPPRPPEKGDGPPVAP